MAGAAASSPLQAQAGQNYGTSVLWTLLLLIPVLLVKQEMCVRPSAVTGVGHGRLILERFGKFGSAFSVGDLFSLNFPTLVTEFISVSLAMSYFGVDPVVSVPIAAADRHHCHDQAGRAVGDGHHAGAEHAGAVQSADHGRNATMGYRPLEGMESVVGRSGRPVRQTRHRP